MDDSEQDLQAGENPPIEWVHERGVEKLERSSIRYGNAIVCFISIDSEIPMKEWSRTCRMSYDENFLSSIFLEDLRICSQDTLFQLFDIFCSVVLIHSTEALIIFRVQTFHMSDFCESFTGIFSCLLFSESIIYDILPRESHRFSENMCRIMCPRKARMNDYIKCLPLLSQRDSSTSRLISSFF